MADPACLSFLLPHEIRALEDFRSRLQERFGNQLKAMKLFGSKVRGTDRLYSDLDVFVLLDVPRIDYEIRETVFGLAWEGLHRYDVDLSPLIYSVDEFKEVLGRERLIARTIEEEGVALL